MSWTDERIDTLRKMWEAGATASQIAEELGGVSRNAVIGKAHRLGLKARPSPVKSNDRVEPVAPILGAATNAAAPQPAPAAVVAKPVTPVAAADPVIAAPPAPRPAAPA